MDKALRYHLINKYRESIARRYDYPTIKSDKKLPKTFTPEMIDELRDFFLQNLYAEPQQREKLDAAFKQLETYVAHPSKVWGLMGSLTSAIFRFGFHFPAAMRAGMAGLHTHTTARHFEDMLLQAAQEREMAIPVSDDEFNACITAIPRENLDEFIKQLADFFLAITDTEMLKKTTEILRDVLAQMREKRDIYGPEDEDAIQLGIDILGKGSELLGKHSPEVRQQIVDFVIYNETKFLNTLYKKKKK